MSNLSLFKMFTFTLTLKNTLCHDSRNTIFKSCCRVADIQVVYVPSRSIKETLNSAWKDENSRKLRCYYLFFLPRCFGEERTAKRTLNFRVKLSPTHLSSMHDGDFIPGPAPGGRAFRGRAPQITSCPPKRELCPPKRGLCPQRK